MERQTPEEMADEIVSRYSGDDLRREIAEAIRSAILHERDCCAYYAQEAIRERARP
jgi:hypothetical protein